MRFYDDVERGLTHKLSADRAYPAFLSKNPVSETWLVDWQAQVPYQLATLNDHLDKTDKRKPPKREITATGRNIALFDALRDIAYKQWRSYQKAGKSRDEFEVMLRTAGNGINLTFTPPLTHVEVKGIARSVAKWVWGEFSEERFSAIQSARGKKRWSKTTTLTATKPWEAEGISSRTWYRQNGTIAISG